VRGRGVLGTSPCSTQESESDRPVINTAFAGYTTPTLCDAIAINDSLGARWYVVESVIRVLNVVFWVAAALLAASLVLLDVSVINAILMVAVVVSSGAIALYEFRLNPLSDTERGEWTGRQLFYALVFTISFFVAFLYVLTVIF
jgi:hypothetical protein